ncbi:MAG: tyrosine--tRNA ligase [Candidatus Omnitrophota bacterium]
MPNKLGNYRITMPVMKIEQQLEIIKRGAVEIISEEELSRKLEEAYTQKRPLRVKAGFDPTAADIHLGHTVLLRKLRQFQDLGHTVFFLIGDFTARIGDPSGRSQLRKPLADKEIIGNARTYKEQVGNILNLKTLKTVFNSHWFARMSVTDILKLTTHTTVSQMLARADFKKRFEREEDISLIEFMYPILQGYDSVQLNSDIEIGGTDQIFNLLVGRGMQKDFGQAPQVIITLPLLEGTDGVNKMSKSLGNYIGITEKSQEMFGKIMSISDELMLKYYTLLTDEDLESIQQMHPKEAKLKLARIIVTQYHSSGAARAAQQEFQRVFTAGELPVDIPVFKIQQPLRLIEIMAESGLSKSGNESRRLIRQGAVVFNNQKVKDENLTVDCPGILKVGSRRFLNIKKQ